MDVQIIVSMTKREGTDGFGLFSCAQEITEDMKCKC